MEVLRHEKTVPPDYFGIEPNLTAAEIIAQRSDASLPNMGLTSWQGEKPRKADVDVAKNYLNAEEVETLNRIVNMYLEFAELQATNKKPMYMADWIRKLDDFLKLTERELLTHVGTVSAEVTKAKATAEFEQFAQGRRELEAPVEAHFADAVGRSKALEKSGGALPGSAPTVRGRK